MGLFSGVTRTVRMAQAGAAVRGGLDQVTASGVFEGDPQALTTRLVALCWAHQPDVFDGKYGKPPHKVATAAIALAAGFEEYANQPGIKTTLVIALGEVLKEVNIRGHLYPFHDLDIALIRRAEQAFFKQADEQQERAAALGLKF